MVSVGDIWRLSLMEWNWDFSFFWVDVQCCFCVACVRLDPVQNTTWQRMGRRFSRSNRNSHLQSSEQWMDIGNSIWSDGDSRCTYHWSCVSCRIVTLLRDGWAIFNRKPTIKSSSTATNHGIVNYRLALPLLSSSWPMVVFDLAISLLSSSMVNQSISARMVQRAHQHRHHNQLGVQAQLSRPW